MTDETIAQATKTKVAIGLVPLLKDTQAVKAAAEAIGTPVEAFADQLGDLIVRFQRRTEDDGRLPNKDFDLVVRRLSSMLKEQNVKHKSPEDACLCGIALGWVFAGYIVGEIRYDNR